MFVSGVILLLVAGFKEWIPNNTSETTDTLALGGLGIIDLTTLFLFKPIKRIHNLMGDMTQITIEVNGYQTQVSLRLLEADRNDRNTFGIAAESIKATAKSSIETIEKYFESKK